MAKQEDTNGWKWQEPHVFEPKIVDGKPEPCLASCGTICAFCETCSSQSYHTATKVLS